MRKILVLDIETTPIENAELALSPFIEHLIGQYKKTKTPAPKGLRDMAEGADDKYQGAIKKAALCPLSSRVLCVGALKVTISEAEFEFDKSPEPEWKFLISKDEPFILQQTNELLHWANELVTFNGRNFDIPFLAFRSVITGQQLELNKLTIPGYKYNGRDRHHDLHGLLVDLSLVGNLDSYITRVSLKKWIKYFGLPFEKKSIATGEINLDELFKSGLWNEIEVYSKGDVMNTHELFKKFFNYCNPPTSYYKNYGD